VKSIQCSINLENGIKFVDAVDLYTFICDTKKFHINFITSPMVSPTGVLVVKESDQARLVSLNAFSNYTVGISAATAAGGGVMSDTLRCHTLEDGKRPLLSIM